MNTYLLIGFCFVALTCTLTSASSEETTYENEDPTFSPLTVQSKQICEICESVATLGRKFLMSPEDQEQVRQIIYEACSLIPNEIANQCKALSSLAPKAMEFAGKFLDPEAVCALPCIFL